MAYNFATAQYVNAFRKLPSVNIPALRAAAIKAAAAEG